MRITLSKDAISGKTEIPAGDYWVSLRQENQEIILVGKGKDFPLHATRRRSQGRTRSTTVQFFAGGGVTLSLVIATPKYGEWVSFLEYKKSERKT